MATWDYHTGGTVSTGSCPKGQISGSTDVYEWVESDSNRVIFSARMDFRAVPGINWDSCNDNYWVHRETDRALIGWGVSDIADPQVTKDRPSTSKNGTESTSLSISTSGAQISWTYTQPDWERNVTGDDVKSTWDLFANNRDASDTTVTWELGSECEFAEGASVQSGDTLCITGGDHTFEDYYWNTEEQFDIWKYFYYG